MKNSQYFGLMWVLSAIAATALPHGILAGLFILSSVASLILSGYFLARELGLLDAITAHPTESESESESESEKEGGGEPEPVEPREPQAPVAVRVLPEEDEGPVSSPVAENKHWTPSTDLPDPVVGYTGGSAPEREYPGERESSILVAERPFRTSNSGKRRTPPRRRRSEGVLSWLLGLVQRYR
ncbi:MAG: hypothetical protein ABT940_00865 [Alphaproteobacteria bacterium]